MQRTEDDIAYYRLRAEQELTGAQHSSIEAAVAAHYQLAELYLAKVTQLEAANDSTTAQSADVENGQGSKPV